MNLRVGMQQVEESELHMLATRVAKSSHTSGAKTRRKQHEKSRDLTTALFNLAGAHRKHAQKMHGAILHQDMWKTENNSRKHGRATAKRTCTERALRSFLCKHKNARCAAPKNRQFATTVPVSRRTRVAHSAHNCNKYKKCRSGGRGKTNFAVEHTLCL